MGSTVIQQKNSGFQGLEVYTGRGGMAGGPDDVDYHERYSVP